VLSVARAKSQRHTNGSLLGVGPIGLPGYEHDGRHAVTNTHAVLDDGVPSRRTGALTRTQLAIIEQIALGRTDKEIAGTIGMSYRTVRTHLERLYDLNDVHCRAALVAVVAASRQLRLLSVRCDPDTRAVDTDRTRAPG
jgi:DNA-binding CsgD family transcriptional regulator